MMVELNTQEESVEEHKRSVVLEARGLTRSFGEHYALVDLDASWHASEVCALLGPNGSGKSTLLNLLSTLMAPSEGGLYLEGERVTRAQSASLRAKIGFVGHHTMLYGGLSALENLKFFAGLYNAWPAEARAGGSDEARRVWLMERLSAVGLDRVADRPARGFSRGMAQRLTLARALLPNPLVLLLDEPFTGLDREGIDRVCELIAAQRDRGASVILSSHDFDTVERLADRALILRRGRLQTLEDAPRGEPGALLALYQRRINA